MENVPDGDLTGTLTFTPETSVRIFALVSAASISQGAGLEETLRKAKQIGDYIERGVVPAKPGAV